MTTQPSPSSLANIFKQIFILHGPLFFKENSRPELKNRTYQCLCQGGMGGGPY